MTFLHKLILTNKFLRFTPFWWWWRVINHQDFRFDDYYVYKEFWNSINSGFMDMEYVHRFEEFWGKGSYPPEKIILSQENFDALVKRMNQPPDPAAVERLKELMSKKAPWEE